MTDLVSLSDIHGRLLPLSETRVPLSAALAELQQMRDGYEAERTATAQNIAMLGAHVGALEGQLATVQAALAVATADVHVFIGKNSVISRTLPAVSLIEKPPIWTTASWANAKASLAQCAGAYKVHLKDFGALDPWPDKTKPIDFKTGQRLANALSKIREIDATAPIVLTLYGAPWWMKGKLSLDGKTTTLLTAAEAYSDSGRVLPEYLPQWLQLVDAAVQLAAAAGVLDFECWNEAKGYYSVPSGAGQMWDARYAAGTPGKADMGYSYFYEATAKQVVATMTRLGFTRDLYRIGGPYPVLSTRGDKSADALPDTHPLNAYSALWGYANKAPIYFVRDFLVEANQHSFPFDTLTLDISTYLQSGAYPTANPFDLSRKIGDVIPFWRKTLVDSGFDADMPIDFTELYPTPQPELQTADSGPLRAAMWADCLKHCVLNRVRFPIAWGPTSPAGGKFGELGGLIAADGSLQPVGEVFRDFRQHFGPGTKVYPLQVSDSRVDGLGSDAVALLYNKTADPLTVAFGGSALSFAGYGRQLVDAATGLPITL